MRLSKLCRSCMKELSSKELENSDEDALTMFLFCINVEIVEEDVLPTHFCLRCNRQIKSSYRYIKEAQKNHEKLMTLIFENKDFINEDFFSHNEDTSSDIEIDNCENLNATTSLIDIDVKPIVDDEVTEEIEPSDPEHPILIDSKHKKKKKATVETSISKLKKSSKVRIRRKRFNINKTKMMESRIKNKSFKSVTAGFKVEDIESAGDTERETIQLKKISKKAEEKRNKEIKKTANDFEIISEDMELKEESSHTDDNVCSITSTRNLRSAQTKTIVKTDYSVIKAKNLHSPLICPICKETFTTVRYLKSHLKKCHKNEVGNFKGYKTDEQKLKMTGVQKEVETCLKCLKTFQSKLWYTRHLQREHSDTKTLSCPHCSKVFPSYASFRCHKRKHEDKKFQCNACDKRFLMQKQLSVHSLTHSDERPFICDHCHMSFKMKHVLVNHMKTHEDVRKILCHICGKGFKTAFSLQVHMPRHTGEKSYACAQCDFRTAYSSTLSKHVKWHSSVRPHVCSYCQKAFPVRTNLIRHLRIHTGEKPCQCPHCPRRFSDHWKRKCHLVRDHQLPFEQIPRLKADGTPCPL